ncbi:MAG: hypothetical protein JWL80_296, partial [Parcubacteria group bacterium]|nr:hypothetical protein [Parcubacteria group bacterium]
MLSVLFVFGVLNFILSFHITQASAATYYVANAGNDSCDGTSQTIGTSGSCSWKTIAKVNTYSFNPGDSILFNKGDTWREQLTVPSSGTAGSPITFGAYGTGANPKILGSAAVSTWTNNTVPAVSADLLDESFNATGYDSPTFTETVGAGSTLDEDSTAIADSAGGSSQILKIQKVSPNWAAWATKDLGADKPISYTQFYAYVTAEGLGNSQQLTLFHATDTAGNHVIDLNFRQNADGTYHFVPARYTGGISTTGTASGNVNLNTWYKIEIKYDKTNMQWEWKLDGTSIQSGSLTAAASNGIRNIRLGSLALDAFTLTAYLDALKISSTDYPNAGSTGNTWKATYSATPVGMWFVDSGGTPHVGRLVANDAAAVNTYDWFTDGVNAYVNSGGTTSGFDPDTLWNSEEASVRSYGMFISSKSYITVQDIDVSYAAIIGIFLWADSDNAIIQRNNTSYNYDGGIAGGVNGTAASDNALVTLNTSTYNGHRGISLDDYGSNWTVSRNITHHNAQDYLQNFGGGIVIYGPHGGRHTIEYNTSYSNGTANSSLGNAIGAGIWIDTVAEILGGASATIRYNTIYGNRYHGIFVEKSSNASVYGNLSYNNVDGSASVAGLAVDAYISHAASNDVFYNNTIYGNYVGIRLRSDQSLSGQISNNTFKNNISTGNTLRQFSAILGAENAGIYGSGNVYEYNMFG